MCERFFLRDPKRKIVWTGKSFVWADIPVETVSKRPNSLIPMLIFKYLVDKLALANVIRAGSTK